MTRNTAPISALHAPLISRPFAVWIAVSVGIHLAVVGAYAWWSDRQSMAMEFPEEPIKAVLVKLGKPRDPKLLPRIPTAPKPPPPADKSVAVPSKDAPTKAEQEDITEQKKSALDRIREQVERDEAAQKAVDRIAERVGPADVEQEGQEDGDAMGDSLTPAQEMSYFASIGAAVKRHYVVPSIIGPGECARLVAQVMVRMGPDGALLDSKIARKSGNDLFDSAVLQAVKAAEPLPAPPEKMRPRVLAGFAFNFRCDK